LSVNAANACAGNTPWTGRVMVGGVVNALTCHVVGPVFGNPHGEGRHLIVAAQEVAQHAESPGRRGPVWSGALSVRVQTYEAVSHTPRLFHNGVSIEDSNSKQKIREIKSHTDPGRRRKVLRPQQPSLARHTPGPPRQGRPSRQVTRQRHS
jgi:hypothetical protein